MFDSRMTAHTLEMPAAVKDEFNYVTDGMVDAGTAPIYITWNDYSAYSNNDFSLLSQSYVGYTNEKKIGKGWVIDGEYTVLYARPTRHGYLLNLEKVSADG